MISVAVCVSLDFTRKQSPFSPHLPCPARGRGKSASSPPLTRERNKGHPRTRLLYITPELSLTDSFRRHLKIVHSQGELARIAIDEAHCISEWGHDFRPAYRHLSHFRHAYPTVPIICLTATATPAVRASIIANLLLSPSKLRMFLIPTARPNLHFEIRFTSDENPDGRFQSLLSWLQAIHARRNDNPELAASRTRASAVSGIIYVPFRTDCDALAARLRGHGIGAAPYHAGLSSPDRATCQRKWIVNEPGHDIVVATTAFGMGIDKQDVRFVVHWCLPKSFEGYYQEAGRAGRDGKAAACVLFYSREDRDRVASRIAKDTSAFTSAERRSGEGGRKGRDASSDDDDLNEGPNHDGGGGGGGPRARQAHSRADSFRQLVAYCERTTRCRHAAISDFFAERDPPPCDFACDFCKDAEGVRRRKGEGLAGEEWGGLG